MLCTLDVAYLELDLLNRALLDFSALSGVVTK